MPAGRPSSFLPEYIGQVEKLCKLGATDIEVADFFEVDVRTVYRWKAENEEFCQAMKTGKEAPDERVVRSLFARATGYEHDEVDIRVVAGEIIQTPIRKYYPPDSTAAIYWLNNRRSDDWKARVEQTVKGDPDAPLEHKVTHTFSQDAADLLSKVRGAAG